MRVILVTLSPANYVGPGSHGQVLNWFFCILNDLDKGCKPPKTASLLNLCIRSAGNFGGGKDDGCGALSCKLSGLSIKMNVPALLPKYSKTGSFAELDKSVWIKIHTIDCKTPF